MNGLNVLVRRGQHSSGTHSPVASVTAEIDVVCRHPHTVRRPTLQGKPLVCGAVDLSSGGAA